VTGGGWFNAWARRSYETWLANGRISEEVLAAHAAQGVPSTEAYLDAIADVDVDEAPPEVDGVGTGPLERAGHHLHHASATLRHAQVSEDGNRHADDPSYSKLAQKPA
jgi:hypothetical protein